MSTLIQPFGQRAALQAAWRGAAYTGLILVGGMLAGVLAGSLVHGGLPGHLREATRVTLAAVPALLGMGLGGALWGRAMASLSPGGQSGRAGWAGMSFGPLVIVVGIFLGVLEVAIVEEGGGPALPVHVVFTLLFVPSAALVSGATGLALGLSLGQGARAWRMAAAVGLISAAAFLAVNLGMDALGWRVGAPGAGERFTMVTVLFLGSLAAALSGGAVLGWQLYRAGRQHDTVQ